MPASAPTDAGISPSCPQNDKQESATPTAMPGASQLRSLESSATSRTMKS